MKLSVKDMMITALFTALMVAGAFIRIPFPLLPITLQAFISALAGLIIGPKLGALSMTLYTVLGLIGLPVFTNGGGITYIFSPSFGFVLGFIAGAFVIGLISKKLGKQNKWNSFKSLMAGLLVIYAVGIPYMFLIMRLYLGNTEARLLLLVTANIPYIIKDIILLSAAALTVPSILPGIRRSFNQ
jgi:biotin transport system substrate-specific component